MLAEEQGGEISAAEITSHLLINKPITYGETVMSRCVDLGLLDPRGGLTAYGREAIEHERIFNQEKGRYRILCTDDPLLPQMVLEIVEQNEPDFLRPRGDFRQSAGPGKSTENEIPKWLFKTENTTFDIFSSGIETRIYKIEPLGLRSELQSSEALEIHLDIPVAGDAVLNVTGYAQRTIQAPPVRYGNAFRQLLGENFDKCWNNESQALQCGFRELTDAERNSFSRDLIVKAPVLNGYGSFNETVIHNVPIIPATNRDANEWARWLLSKSITKFTDRNSYDRLVKNIQTRFIGFNFILPTLDETAGTERRVSIQNTGRPSRSYWYLQAPIDLQMPEESK
jgi:hypothetical protein